MDHFGGQVISMGSLVFVVGGAASGKSAYAERLVRALGKPKTYIATLQAFDDEMHDKIAKHRRDRGADWTTIEAPLDVYGPLSQIDASHVVLLDCVTLWLTNVMLAEKDIDSEIETLLGAIRSTQCDVVVVSNEVGMGIVPDNALSRRFRAAQGGLNQRLSRVADTVVTVIAGLPLALKGNLPVIYDQ
ncbi:MAG: bifunctional adenosylcobinamide kinase/adenosylcobinamide-phosphate guanylyltransferase [Pseudomonadota bacterium]